MEKREVVCYEKTIHDIEQQILILSEKKEQLKKKKEELLPNGLDVLIENSKKRKREQIETTEEFAELKYCLNPKRKKVKKQMNIKC